MNRHLSHLLAAMGIGLIGTIDVHAQNVTGLRPDPVEAQRASALASVLGKTDGRARTDSRLSFAAPGTKSCEINVGDVQAESSEDNFAPLGTPRKRRGLARYHFVTVVEAPLICVTR